MIDIRTTCLQVIAFSLVVMTGDFAIAQQSTALTEEERAKAVAAEKALADQLLAVPAAAREGRIPGLAATKAGRAAKSVVTSIVPIGSASTVRRSGLTAPASASGTRRAMVMRYDYATGITTRTTIDIASGKVLAVRSKVNYPTPLAPSELEEAKALLQSSVPEIDKIVKEHDANKVVFYHLTPIASNATAPKYGHRLVWLWVAEPVHTDKYVVDLSTGEVEKKN
ncbi:MAG: hypothetical protein ACR2PA_00070 [Hyphomicrobiaceae bacterium]